jgi:hypothetical protein
MRDFDPILLLPEMRSMTDAQRADLTVPVITVM